MKHLTWANAFHPMLNQLPWFLIYSLTICIATASCKKENFYDQDKSQTQAKEENKMQKVKPEPGTRLDSVKLNRTSVTMTLTFKTNQLSQAIYYFKDGSVKWNASYEITSRNSAGSVGTNDLRGKILRIKVHNDGVYEYEPDSSGRIVRATFYSEISGNLLPGKRMEYEYGQDIDGNDFLIWRRDYGGAGLDVLIAQTGYDRNANGTIKAIRVYEGPDMKLKGKVIMENNATPRQVAAWKQIAQIFPEPDKPWEILTMLNKRTEMHGSGTVADDVIVDGRIITAENLNFSSTGFLQSKTLVHTDSQRPGVVYPTESVSFYYTQIK